jgi:hypothetical protein
MTDTPVKRTAVLAVQLLEAILENRIATDDEAIDAYSAGDESAVNLDGLDATMTAIFEEPEHIPQVIMHLASLFGSAILTIGAALTKTVGINSETISIEVAKAFKDKLFYHYLLSIQELAENHPDLSVPRDQPDAAAWIADVAANVDELLNEGRQ